MSQLLKRILHDTVVYQLQIEDSRKVLRNFFGKTNFEEKTGEREEIKWTLVEQSAIGRYVVGCRVQTFYRFIPRAD